MENDKTTPEDLSGRALRLLGADYPNAGNVHADLSEALDRLEVERRNHGATAAVRLHWRGRANRAEDYLRREQERHAATQVERNDNDLRARAGRCRADKAEAEAQRLARECEGLRWALVRVRDLSPTLTAAENEARAALSPPQPATAPETTTDTPDNQRGPQTGAEGACAPDGETA